MIITFRGHADYIKHAQHEQKILDMLQKEIGNNPVELFFGGYGSFDVFALHCGIKYRSTHPNTKLILVTPYLSKPSSCYMKKKVRRRMIAFFIRPWKTFHPNTQLFTVTVGSLNRRT